MKGLLVLVILLNIIVANDSLNFELLNSKNLNKIYKYLPTKYKKDKDFTIAVVQRYGHLLG